MKMHSDQRIFADMAGAVPSEDVARVVKVTEAWADALDKLGDANTVRIVFLACMNAIETMGPAYCRLAAANLLKAAQEQEQ